MNRTEFNLFLKRQIHSQGTASSISLSELVKELAHHVTYVIHISDNPTTQDGTTTYKVINPQAEIDEIIDEASSSEMVHIVMHDNGVTLHFNHIEAEDNLIVCYLTTGGGTYTLKLSKESGFSELSYAKN